MEQQSELCQHQTVDSGSGKEESSRTADVPREEGSAEDPADQRVEMPLQSELRQHQTVDSDSGKEESSQTADVPKEEGSAEDPANQHVEMGGLLQQSELGRQQQTMASDKDGPKDVGEEGPTKTQEPTNPVVLGLVVAATVTGLSYSFSSQGLRKKMVAKIFGGDGGQAIIRNSTILLSGCTLAVAATTWLRRFLNNRTEKRRKVTEELMRQADSCMEGADYAGAEPLYLETKRILAKVVGSQHPEYATVLEHLGVLYIEVGDFKKAEVLLMKCMVIRAKAMGIEHPEYAATLRNLARLHVITGDFSRAEPLYLQCKEIQAQALGTQDSEYAATLDNLASLYTKTGDFGRAEPLYLQCRDVQAQMFGTQHRKYAGTLSHLAGLYMTTGDFGRAGPLLHECMEIEAKVLGTQHPHYAATLNSLAALYMNTGDFSRAEPLLLECRDIETQVLGAQHHKCAATLGNLAILYENTGDFQRAEPLYLQCMDIQAQVLGAQHPEYAATLGNLAGLCARTGDFNRAEQLYLQCKDIQAHALGMQHPDYAATLGNLAGLCEKTGDFNRAESLYLRCRDIQAQALGTQHPQYAATLGNLANLYQDTGDFNRAESLYLRCRDIQAQALGTQHPVYGATLGNLAILHYTIGDFSKAETLFLECKEIEAQALGTQHPEYAATLGNLAELYEAMGDLPRAEPLYLECKDIQAQTIGTQHPQFATVLNHLASLYKAKGEVAKAKPLCQESRDIVAKVLSTQHPHYADALNNLAGLHEAEGDFAEAERLYTECRDIRAQVLGRQHQDYAAALQGLAGVYLKMLRSGEAFEALETAAKTLFRVMTVLLPALPERRMLLSVKKLDNTVQRLVAVAVLASQHGDPSATERAYNTVSICKNVVLDAQMPTAREENVELRAARWRLSRLVTSSEAELGDVSQTIGALWDKVEQLEAASGRQSRSSDYLDESSSMNKRISAKLPPHTALAEYAVSATDSGPRYVVFLVNGSPAVNVCVLDVGPVPEIDAQIQKFLRFVRSEAQMYRKVGVSLREKLLDPVVKLLDPAVSATGPQTKHLFVVPDGQLATLPFAVLPSGDRDFVLNWDLDISFLSSARDLLQENLPESRPALGRSVVIANPDYGSTTHEGPSFETDCDAMRGCVPLLDMQRAVAAFKDLPGTETEGQSVKELLEDADLLTRGSATVGALLRVSRPRVLHVAAHGFFLPAGVKPGGRLEETVGRQENPLLRSGIPLAGAGAWQKGEEAKTGSDNGIATALDLLSLDLEGTELATISACQSGLGDCLVGQGVSGLGRSLKLAGAKHVVLSLWNIKDSITAEIMQTFYSALRKNGTGAVHKYAEAMRAAQRTIMQARPDVPKLWGAFVVYGYNC